MSTIVTKKKFSLSIQQRLDIIRDLESLLPVSIIAAKYHMHPTTIRRIRRNAAAITEIAEKNIMQKNRRRIRKPLYQELEHRLATWFIERKMLGDVFTDALLLEKAIELKDSIPSCSSFKVSRGWLAKFKRRNNIRLVHPYNEMESDNRKLTERGNFIQEEEYPEDFEDGDFEEEESQEREAQKEQIGEEKFQTDHVEEEKMEVQQEAQEVKIKEEPQEEKVHEERITVEPLQVERIHEERIVVEPLQVEEIREERVTEEEVHEENVTVKSLRVEKVHEENVSVDTLQVQEVHEENVVETLQVQGVHEENVTVKTLQEEEDHKERIAVQMRQEEAHKKGITVQAPQTVEVRGRSFHEEEVYEEKIVIDTFQREKERTVPIQESSIQGIKQEVVHGEEHPEKQNNNGSGDHSDKENSKNELKYLFERLDYHSTREPRYIQQMVKGLKLYFLAKVASKG